MKRNLKNLLGVGVVATSLLLTGCSEKKDIAAGNETVDRVATAADLGDPARVRALQSAAKEDLTKEVVLYKDMQGNSTNSVWLEAQKAYVLEAVIASSIAQDGNQLARFQNFGVDVRIHKGTNGLESLVVGISDRLKVVTTTSLDLSTSR